MSGPAQLLRLHILLESVALLRVFDRLSVLGLVPRAMEFRKGEKGEGRLALELDPLEPHMAESLLARLGQIPAVISVESEDPALPASAAER